MSSSDPETTRPSLADLWRDLTTAQAVVLSAAAVMLFIGGLYLTSQAQRRQDPERTSQVNYLPNPQGGIWVHTDADLYLCRAVGDAPGQCFSMETDKQLTFTELGLH
ncbi:hypothetical protein NBRC116588_30470 [Pyruvatibacter sp. HU-CL02332]